MAHIGTLQLNYKKIKISKRPLGPESLIIFCWDVLLSVAAAMAQIFLYLLTRHP